MKLCLLREIPTGLPGPSDLPAPRARPGPPALAI